MRLVVDAQCLQSPDSGARGVGRYARNLLNAIAGARPDWQIEAVQNTQLPAIAPDSLHQRISLTSFDPLLPIRAATRAANDRFFGEWLCTRGADAILELNFFEEHTVVPSFPSERPLLTGVVYDLIPVLFHKHYLGDLQKMTWYAERLRQFAAVDMALAISETTKSDVLRLMRWGTERVTTIGGAPEPAVIPGATDEQARMLRDLGIDRPFILCVAGVDMRKNLHGTLAGFAALPSRIRVAHQLVIVCALSDVQRSRLQNDTRALGIAGDVRFTGFVDDETLHALYERCRASVFLSFYEGLGLPVLEALRAGAPVVASSRSSIPEFSDPSTILVDPSSTSAFVAGVESVLSRPREDGAADRRRFAVQFTWERTAAAAVAAIESASQPRVRRTARWRIAWVSPLPPTRSGIADYSHELLRCFPQELFDIELIVSAQATLDRELSARYRVFNEHEVHARHIDAPFDLFVYHVGNSDLHVYMLDLMRRYSGLTVLHELYLGGLALRAADVGAWPDLSDDLAEEGAADLAAAMRAGEADHGRIATEAPLHGRLVALSDAVVVHSAWSYRRLRHESRVPVFHVPMGIDSPEVESIEAARARLGIAPDAFLIATLGEVTASKRLDRLIEAVAALPPSLRDKTRLVVMGDAAAPLRDRLLAQAAAAGLDDRIRFTGRVPLATLATCARAADACVQLRYPTRGETSAALLRALAAGAACIVSDTDGFAEVPADIALRVRTPEQEVPDLADALSRLYRDRALAEGLRRQALTFVSREHRLEVAADRYRAAMTLTIARRRREDGNWRDVAASALATAAGDVAISDEVISRWAEVRCAAGRR